VDVSSLRLVIGMMDRWTDGFSALYIWIAQVHSFKNFHTLASFVWGHTLFTARLFLCTSYDRNV